MRYVIEAVYIHNQDRMTALSAVSTADRRPVIPRMESHDAQAIVSLRFSMATGMSFTCVCHTIPPSFYASVTGLAGETSEHLRLSPVTVDRATAMSREYVLE